MDNKDLQNNNLSLEQDTNLSENEQIINQEPTWKDIEDGKVNFKDLPKETKEKVKQEAYEQTPDDKKYLWDEYGYTPPEIYKGFDRNGRQVEGFNLDGFEELVKKGKIKQKTKIEEDLEKLTNVVKQQSKLLVSNQEKEINKKILELKEKGLYEEEDFKEYEKALAEKNNLEFQKNEYKEEEIQENLPFSLEEQADIRTFSYSNKIFLDVIKKDSALTRFFDEQAFSLRQKNPNAPLIDIMNAAKKITENTFNPRKQIPMQIQREETKTNLSVNKEDEFKINYNTLSPQIKAWVDCAIKVGKFKEISLVGKTPSEVATIIFKNNT